MSLETEHLEYLDLLSAKERKLHYNRRILCFPEKGQFRRELYPKHMEFLAAGKDYPQRIFLAGNRTGKSETAALEVSYHLTGNYPEWWKGRVFNRPVKVWACGKTGVKTQEIVQTKLLGTKSDMGSGMIPKELLDRGRLVSKHGIADGIEKAEVPYSSGGMSQLVFKSYDQGYENFVGDEVDIIWLDEECPSKVYIECLARLMTTKGIILITFTPDNGLSETVLTFFESGKIIVGANGFKYTVMVDWDECPHISEAAKQQMIASIPPYALAAKKSGIPYLGAGSIYPISESEIVVSPFEIPPHWLRCYAMDVGWNRTAAIWGAIDPSTETIYLYHEYYRGQAEPVIHTQAIKAVGDWIPGVIDPASRGRSTVDGRQLMCLYQDLGLDVSFADNSVESGLYNVWQRLSAGNLKVFSHLQYWLSEFRIYRRNEKGEIIKKDDHLMDSTRYLIMSGIHRAISEPWYLEDQVFLNNVEVGRSEVGGY